MPKYLYVLACCIVQPSITTGSYAHIPLGLNFFSFISTENKTMTVILHFE